MDFGNLSEIVAAVAVVISLVYLAMQVRENTRATTLAATRELFSAAQEAIAANSSDDVYMQASKYGSDMQILYMPTRCFQPVAQVPQQLAVKLGPEVARIPPFPSN